MSQKTWVCVHCQNPHSCFRESDKIYHIKLCRDITELKIAISSLTKRKKICDSKIAANLKELTLLELKAELKEKTERIKQDFEYAFRRAKHEARKAKEEKSQLSRKRKSPSSK